LRVPSYEPKKNVWLRRIGPPTVAPNWLNVCGGVVAEK
jgi:hypothetical protein